MLRIIQNQFSKYNFAIEKKLFIYDNGYSNPNHNNSGIRATIFGASGTSQFIKVSLEQNLHPL